MVRNRPDSGCTPSVRLGINCRASSCAVLGKAAPPRSPCDLTPPFTLDTPLAKVHAAEDARNSRDPERVALACSPDSERRHRDTFLRGRDEIRAFLRCKWGREIDCRLAKSLWGFRENRIAVRFQYEWRDAKAHWFRSSGNELWAFDDAGLMRRREASINVIAIAEPDRRFRWPVSGSRPQSHTGTVALTPEQLAAFQQLGTA